MFRVLRGQIASSGSNLKNSNGFGFVFRLLCFKGTSKKNDNLFSDLLISLMFSNLISPPLDAAARAVSIAVFHDRSFSPMVSFGRVLR